MPVYKKSVDSNGKEGVCVYVYVYLGEAEGQEIIIYEKI